MTASTHRTGVGPRLLFVGAYPPASLAGRAASDDLARRLAGDGWSVAVTSRRSTRLGRTADMLWTAWRSRHRVDVGLVDVFSGSAFAWAEATTGLLRRLGRPVVLTLHGGNLPAFAERHPGRVRRLLARASAVTAPSSYLSTALAPHRADIRVIPNPLPLEAYPFSPRDRPAPRLVWLRAFHDIYNPAMAVRVVAALRSEFPDVRLAMIGPDKDGSAERTRAEAETLGVADCVEFVGPVPKTDVPRRLAAGGDIFLNTTNVDNTPVSVLEALACGLCVVSTDAGGIPFLLAHDRDALLVPVGDERAMTAAVRRLLTEPGLAARLSRSGRAAVESFGWEQVLAQWKSLLAEVVTPAEAARG